MFISIEKQPPFPTDGYYKTTTELHLKSGDGRFAKGSLLRIFKKDDVWFVLNDGLTFTADDIDEDIFSEGQLIKTKEILEYEERSESLKKEFNEYKANYIAKLGWFKKLIFKADDDAEVSTEIIIASCATLITALLAWIFGLLEFIYIQFNESVALTILSAMMILALTFVVFMIIAMPLIFHVSDKMHDEVDRGRSAILNEILELHKQCVQVTEQGIL